MNCALIVSCLVMAVRRRLDWNNPVPFALPPSSASVQAAAAGHHPDVDTAVPRTCRCTLPASDEVVSDRLGWRGPPAAPRLAAPALPAAAPPDLGDLLLRRWNWDARRLGASLPPRQSHVAGRRGPVAVRRATSDGHADPASPDPRRRCAPPLVGASSPVRVPRPRSGRRTDGGGRRRHRGSLLGGGGGGGGSDSAGTVVDDRVAWHTVSQTAGQRDLSAAPSSACTLAPGTHSLASRCILATSERHLATRKVITNQRRFPVCRSTFSRHLDAIVCFWFTDVLRCIDQCVQLHLGHAQSFTRLLIHSSDFRVLFRGQKVKLQTVSETFWCFLCVFNFASRNQLSEYITPRFRVCRSYRLQRSTIILRTYYFFSAIFCSLSLFCCID